MSNGSTTVVEVETQETSRHSKTAANPEKKRTLNVWGNFKGGGWARGERNGPPPL